MHAGNHVLRLAAGLAGSLPITALAQQFVNPGFETGTLSGWSVNLTPNGATLLQTVERTDIDGPGPLFPSLAAKFQVGQAAATPTVQEGVELSQTLDLLAGVTYAISFNWMAARDSGASNAEGGVFTLFVDSADLNSNSAGSTGTTPRTGYLEMFHTPAQSGPHRIGVRITRPFTPIEGISQRIDNFIIARATPGACCFPDGTCAQLLQGQCASQGGAFAGYEVSCQAAECPPAPEGACCVGGSCQPLTRAACLASGGSYLGDNSACPVAACPDSLFTAEPNAQVIAAMGGVFFDLAATRSILVPRLDYYCNATAGHATSIQVWTREGSYVGHDASPAGWFFRETINVVSAGPSATVPLNLTTPLQISAGSTMGVYLIAYSGGIRVSGTTTAPPQTSYSDDNLAIFSERMRTSPWSGTLTTPRAWSGRVWYAVVPSPATCYANCDESTQPPILNVADFTCFLQKFAAGDAYANCDNSTQPPILNVADFTCFLQKFASGCP